jgi:hypothetical protein
MEDLKINILINLLNEEVAHLDNIKLTTKDDEILNIVKRDISIISRYTFIALQLKKMDKIKRMYDELINN